MSGLSSSFSAAAAGEFVQKRVLAASREKVFAAFADPLALARWWGQKGFTNEFHEFDFRVGGVWCFTMHAPDNTRYPNKSIFMEIVPQERIVYLHGDGREDGEVPEANFVATRTFTPIDGDKTEVTGRLLFPSAAMRDQVVREFGAIEGGRQTLERLGEQLAAMQSIPFVISREFAAPRDLVWRVWTEREHFARWFGPKGAAMALAQFDLRPGGLCYYSMTMPGGKKLWGKAVYREVVPPTKIVWINSFSDEHAGIQRHPLVVDRWPLQLLTVVTFAEQAGRTQVTVTWLPIDADDDERRVFENQRPGMHGDWSGTFDQLAAYLAEARSLT